MKSSITLLVLPALLAFGCGGSKKVVTMTQPDLSVADKGDMTVGDNCTKVAAWGTSKLIAFHDTTQAAFPYVDGVGDVENDAANPAHHDELLYRYYQESGKPAAKVPHDYDIDPDADTFGTCIDCVTAFLDYDPNDQTATGTFYFAISGSVHVSKLDTTDPTGTVSVSGTDLHLVHWDYMGQTDKADDDGKCIDVASFDFTADYDNTATDGGVDGGN